VPDPHLHNFSIHLLTALAKPILPGGYWAKNARRQILPHDDQSATTGSGADSRGKSTSGRAAGPKVNPNDNLTVNLTYDDGPNPLTTPGLVKLLDEEGIKATFFFIGQNIEKYPELVELVFKSGHTVANHSYSHPFMPGLSRARMAAEIDKTNALIEAITGHKTHLFRPPYGIIDGRGAKLLEERRMSPVYWGAVTEDWRNIGADAVVKHIMKRLPTAQLIVMHEGHDIADQCLSATGTIIGRVKDAGYHFAAIK